MIRKSPMPGLPVWEIFCLIFLRKLKIFQDSFGIMRKNKNRGKNYENNEKNSSMDAAVCAGFNQRTFV